MRAALFLSLVLLPLAPTRGQTQVEQIDAAPGDRDSDADAAADQRAAPANAGVAQLNRREDARAPLPQVTRPEDRAANRGGAPQLARPSRAVEATPPLSRPAEGRTAAVTPIQGRDRCDPRAITPPPAECARVIETRAAEFARTEPMLSPEQRLLADQRGPAPVNDQIAARRLAASGAATSLETQEIAAVVLSDRPTTRPVDPEPPAQRVDPSIQGIINRLTTPQ
ncbi:MAG: hypothetical protein A4S12_02240 [Proteobacteria bacterium SG_bin5]|nr:hypothetical protein [Sphingomonas sp.]OQW39391.1 MAG: hypothetical protein A4S12_02240 [Proteobacteria bacterium SG_bin5]